MTLGGTVSRRYSLEPKDEFDPLPSPLRAPILAAGIAICKKSLEHRKPWLERKIAELAEIFACSVLSYAVMSNHFHLVVSMLPAEANAWSAQQVAARWCRLFAKKKSDEHQAKIDAIAANAASVAVCRQRLHDLTWLMKMISEPIARRANAEDKTNGRFWQGLSRRFGAAGARRLKRSRQGAEGRVA